MSHVTSTPRSFVSSWEFARGGCSRFLSGMAGRGGGAIKRLARQLKTFISAGRLLAGRMAW